MKCPNCGSNDIFSAPITTTTTRSKTTGFNGCNACCGFLLFQWPGILCGLCGSGKEKMKTTHITRIEHVCRQCGKKF